MEQFREWLAISLKKLSPQIAIGIGPCTTPAVKSLKIAATVCKEICPKVPLIYGGPLASLPGQEELFFSDFFADVVIPGDGEYVLCEVLVALRDNQQLENISGITTANVKSSYSNIVDDLDKLPFPQRSLVLDNKKYSLSIRRNLFANPFINLSISRGCKYNCSFCVSARLRNGMYHRRTTESIISEIKHLLHRSDIRTVVFYDDTFFPSINTLEADINEFTRAISKLDKNVLWQIEMRPDILTELDGSIAHLLYEAGCRQINIGIEKMQPANSAVLGKKIDPDTLRRACQQICAGAPFMRLTGTFILGGPGEDHATIKDTIDFSTSLGLLFAHFYPLELYQGTALYEEVNAEQDTATWYHKIMSDDLSWGEVIYENEILSRNALLNSVSNAYTAFYSREAWHQLARRMLGKNYVEIANVVSEWSKDRFNLKRKI